MRHVICAGCLVLLGCTMEAHVGSPDEHGLASDAGGTGEGTWPGEVLASAIVPYDLAATTSAVHWIDYDEGVRGLAKASGAAEFHDPGVAVDFSPQAIVVSGDRLYYPGSGGTIRRIDGTTATTVFDGGSSRHLAADERSVYVSLDDGPIVAIPNDGSPSYRIVETGGGGPLAVDATHVYYLAGLEVRRAPKTGASVPATIAVLAPSTIGTATDLDLLVVGDHLYYLGVDAILRLPISGGPPEVFASGNVVTRFVADGDVIYWTDYLAGGGAVTGRIFRQPTAGGAAELIATVSGDDGQILALAVDHEHVYFGTPSATGAHPGAIHRLAK